MVAPLRKNNTFTQDTGGYAVAANDDSYYSNDRRVSPNKSDLLNQSNRVRNIRTKSRTSTMPGAPKNVQFDSHKTDIATEFNQSYAKQGIQPSSLEDKRDHRPYQPIKQITRARVEYSNSVTTPKTPARTSVVKLKRKNNSSSALDRTLVTGLNIGIRSAGLFTWSIFQAPFAILSLMALGLAIAVSAFLSKLNPTPEDGVIWTIIKTVTGSAVKLSSWAAEKVLSVFNVDITTVNPTNLFLVFHFLVSFYGIILLLTIYLVYKLAGLEPLSGNGAGFKMGMLLLAFAGYLIPIINIIPWFMPWTIAVKFFPK